MIMAIAIITKFPIQRLLALQLPARVRTKELLLFYTQMTILIESGTSVPLGLDALAKQMPTSYCKQVVIHLTQLVREGHMIDVYQEAGVSLPIITRLLLVVYAAVANYWFICLPLLAGIIWLALCYLRSPHAAHFVTQE